MAYTLSTLTTTAGIKRDGTEFESNFYNDAQHCRWQRGRPRKMGGYRQISNQFSGPVRGMNVSAYDGVTSIHTGHKAGLERVEVDQNGFGAGIIDRTPVGFATDTRIVWQFEQMWDAAGSKMMIIAHPGYNVNAIDNSVASPIYVGDVNATTAFTPQSTSVAGGVVVLPPFLVTYDNNGQVSWSDENLPLSMTGGVSGTARVAQSKIVKGLVFRGGPSNSPSGMLWSLDSLIRMSFVGGQAVFRFDYVSDQISVLSSSAIIEYDGIFYWPAVDRFLTYNGVVREIPNAMNQNWFFDNLNYSQRQKVWAMKVPRFGEIWWLYPRGSATECTHAVIYNVRENTWYDTELARSAGHFAQVFRYPVMADSAIDTTSSKYQTWTHEVGYDKIVGSKVSAIQSYFQTADISTCADGPMQQAWNGQDRWVQLQRVEPDFNQVGEMTVTVQGHKYAKSSLVDVVEKTFDPTTEKVDLKCQARQLRLKFTSNTVGGFYEMGQTLIALQTGDGRQ
jgi:hypothetical protein